MPQFMSTQALTYAAPSEEGLNSAYHERYTGICGVNIEHLLDAARAVLQLPKAVAPTEIRILAHGGYNKVFLIQFGASALVARVPVPKPPATRDPLRLKSQIATLGFMSVYRPDVPIPRLFSAQLSGTNPAGVPYTFIEFCNGTPLTPPEWHDMSDASKRIVVDLLAEQWARTTAPVPFSAIGSIVADSADTSRSLWQRHSTPQRGFRIMPVIPQYPSAFTELLDPSIEARCGPTTLAEHWHYALDATRRAMVKKSPQWSDDGRRTFVRCADIIRDLVNIAASLDPLANSTSRPAASNLALVHGDFACWRNVLFSADRTRIEGIIDWDDSVVVPRDIAARYPEELTNQAWWPADPEDVFVIPPEVLPEDMFSCQIAMEHTQLRKRFRDTVQRFDPQLAMLYTDPRARFRRRVDYLAMHDWRGWLSYIDWILEKAMDEAYALAGNWRA
ncbi:uncharacterized protein B0H18DRAFT_104420 [Fomitopsis serialis]|uniref:uncharacterized protein n=1 Tax=Fomitopsis serialis TaxID=139415 RepID=UPI0020079A05|nr:uncharacterized protein B0H18DRAFT_104420 [Neoantrodia serialis]KAH9931325.1 hypothetical protein B0H18DRAFT_104420 [Neoantrodia serialis]